MKLVFLLVLLVGCGSLKNGEKQDLPRAKESQFEFTDTSGDFVLVRKNMIKSQNEFYTLLDLMSKNTKNKKELLEKVVMSSELGKIERKSENNFGKSKGKEANSILVLRPKASQHTVWLDGQKFVTQLKVNTGKRVIDVLTQSSDKKTDKKSIKIPSDRSLFCFFEQIPECVKVTGFIRKAIRDKGGRIGLYVIWTSYPFINEQFSNMSSELFSTAEMEYDEVDDEGLIRFNLQVQDQTLFFHFELDGEFSKMFWVAQGLSMTKMGP